MDTTPAFSPVKIALFGVGHLGKIHLKLLMGLAEYDVVGIYEPDAERAAEMSAEFEVEVWTDREALLAEVEAVDIVTPTFAHFESAARALRAGKHIFIEKPLTETPEEARELLDLLEANPELKGAVGHVERYNPGLLSVADRDIKPMFIEGHRLAMYNPRGTDVSVVLDLMIHDLDVVLSLVDSPVREVHASGVAIISDTPDIANARLTFENGCVANLTASRISLKNMRRLRMFQKNTYLAVDFLDKQAELLHLSDDDDGKTEPGKIKMKMDRGDGTKYLIFEKPQAPEVNAIEMELKEFAEAIRTGSRLRVPLRAGYRALETAHRIVAKIEEGIAGLDE